MLHWGEERHPLPSDFVRRAQAREKRSPMYPFKRISIVTGHYGSGKTNIAVNMALSLAAGGQRSVTVVDLDIVNPYFRTADCRPRLEKAGIRVIAPVYANTNLDSPVLPPEIGGVFREDGGFCVIDVGGDDAGAVALGQFASRAEAVGYDMFYVINGKRYLTREPSQTAELLREIEQSSRLRATGLINNTNLGEETSLSLVESSLPYAEAVSALTGLPLAFTCADRRLLAGGDSPYVPIDIIVRQDFGR